jgi:hypothetical protein
MVMMDETSMLWFSLRERRAGLLDRSRLKASASRRQTFAAAMAQFEEQMTAARIVSPATRPLNLYYGLTQAGMAIAAAHAPDPWSFASHGLKLLDTAPDLPEIEVRPDGEGGFQRLAAVVGSSHIAAPVSLGSLWRSLPELIDFAVLPGPAKPSVLRATADPGPAGFLQAPPRSVHVFYSGPAAVRVRIKISALPASGDIGLDSLRDWKIDASEWPVQEVRPEEDLSVRMLLPGSAKQPSMPASEMSAIIDAVAPEYRYRSERFVRPSVEGEGKSAPSPLMTWWLLLYSFSVLARYQPRKWTRLLDLDTPGYAASLQFCLEAALSAIPHLVLEALDKEPHLLPRSNADLGQSDENWYCGVRLCLGQTNSQ